MQFVRNLLLCGLLSLLISGTVNAQNASSSSTTVVPQLVGFSGTAINEQGTPVTGIVGITFSIYNAQQGGSPLWIETQDVQADGKGDYTVQLGATTSQGLPLDLFASGEARWLGASVNGGEEQPRVLLLSVPYALKAADAQTLGGLPASAFVLAAPSGSSGSAPNAPANPGSPESPALSGTGTTDFVPLWTNSTTLGDSVLFQSGTGSTAKVGINNTTPLTTLDVKGSATVRGYLETPAIANATASQGSNSNPMVLVASSFNSGTSKAVTQNFVWQAEPVGNDTNTPSGTLNLLFGAGTATPAETGLHVTSNGQINFATGQTFPGTGTISGVTTASGSGLTGGGTSGTLNLALTNACAANQVLQWNGSAWGCTTISGGGSITGVTAGTDLTGGGTSGNVTLNVDTTKVPQLNAANTFTGNQTVNGNLSATGMVSGSGFQIGSNLFDYGSFSNGNAFLGFSGNTTMAGQFNTASGQFALSSNTTGSFNTASGSSALSANTTGNDNTASGALALSGNITGSDSTAVGYFALANSNASQPNDAFGSGALYSNQGGAENVAVGYQALWSNVGDSFGDGSFNTAVGYRALYMNNSTNGAGAYAQNNVATGALALYSNTTGVDNIANGVQALYSNTTGNNNIASGLGALFSNTTTGFNTAIGELTLYYNAADYNTAVGNFALIANTTGSSNTAVGVDALESNTTGSNLTCIGFECNAAGDLTNATAIGAHALVEQSNSLVLGAVGVNVGIGTTKPSNILTIGRGAGHPVSDSWETYSSRRWKTNIQTLPNALSKVEQLRGVSYDLKDSGRHEIGVIAEEVGKVIPEVVTYEDNGKDARGVDYSRLTALLIEAVKQQQKQIALQRSQIARLSRKVGVLESSLRSSHAEASVLVASRSGTLLKGSRK